MRFFVIISLAVGLLTYPLSGLAEPISADQSRQPVEVTADRLEADDAQHSLVFIGNAVAQQGDITIYAERLTVHYTAVERDIEQIIAEDQVRIIQGERIATGQKAVFDRLEEKVTLTGSPQVQEGENLVTGTEIVLLLEENRSVVQGGQDGRVKAVFVPKSGAKP